MAPALVQYIYNAGWAFFRQFLRSHALTQTRNKNLAMDYVHSLADYALSFGKLVRLQELCFLSSLRRSHAKPQAQNRQVGWLTKNRKTGELIRERQPLTKKAKLLLLFNPVTEWVDRTRLFRFYMHERTDHEGKTEVRVHSPLSSFVLNTWN